MAVTPHGVLPRDSHEIPPAIGGGTQVADFTRGFIRGKHTNNLRRRNRGGQGDPDPLMLCRTHFFATNTQQIFTHTLSIPLKSPTMVVAEASQVFVRTRL